MHETENNETAAPSITVEFSGGLEALFANQRELRLALEPTTATLAELVRRLCDEAMSDARREMFVVDGHVRPGILVLINDADWELEGEEAYRLRAGDRIVFVSTLHGG